MTEVADAKRFFWGTGRRKTAVARVRIRPGSGKFLVNKKSPEEYFNNERDRMLAHKPFKVTETTGKYDVFANVFGGGIAGQAGALVLGIARALVRADPSLERTLREAGMLTRDSRMKERKKYGHKKARKSFQFSKR